jgi:hypothetical protein
MRLPASAAMILKFVGFFVELKVLGIACIFPIEFTAFFLFLDHFVHGFGIYKAQI